MADLKDKFEDLENKAIEMKGKAKGRIEQKKKDSQK